MALRIEDYAMIGDGHTAALVGSNGSIDWLCVPSFDSGACFASLLGTEDNGFWRIAPQGEVRSVRRRYRPGTLILETTLETADGVVTLIDGMGMEESNRVVVRFVRGERGQVPMRLEYAVRFDYGWIVPWVTRGENGLRAVAGPDTLLLHTDVKLHGEDTRTVGDFTVAEGQETAFTLLWYPSHEEEPEVPDAHAILKRAESWWRRWSERCQYKGPHEVLVRRSLITLRALAYQPTGGVVAAPTMSLPEKLGGVRNWDYRYCWIRDATFTLFALMNAGYQEEARRFREWVLRAVAGKPSDMQIMYSITGRRRLTELTLDWLDGYEGSKPVRMGNAASGQFQLDVYGELMDAMYQARRIGLEKEQAAWNVERSLLDFLESAWNQPDDGIWEMRGGRRQFTHSKVMAWVAFDRAIKSVETFRLNGPVEKWRRICDTIHQEVCERGFNRDLNSFTQTFDGPHLDASLLMMPLVGFLPANDPRVKGTVAAIEKHLMKDGFVQRYDTAAVKDHLPPGEGAFLPCTFWLVDNYVLQGRQDEAEKLFDRLVGLCNDVGLISEEYDPQAQRLVGNFPQAFTHVGLVNSALNLHHARKPAEERQK